MFINLFWGIFFLSLVEKNGMMYIHDKTVIYLFILRIVFCFELFINVFEILFLVPKFLTIFQGQNHTRFYNKKSWVFFFLLTKVGFILSDRPPISFYLGLRSLTVVLGLNVCLLVKAKQTGGVAKNPFTFLSISFLLLHTEPGRSLKFPSLFTTLPWLVTLSLCISLTVSESEQIPHKVFVLALHHLLFITKVVLQREPVFTEVIYFLEKVSKVFFLLFLLFIFSCLVFP
jgi:hypothetical protein